MPSVFPSSHLKQLSGVLCNEASGVLRHLVSLLCFQGQLHENNFSRQWRGLGFNIVGGTDQQYIANDNSIYVSWIKKDGAAYQDGRLQEGDKILAINGKELKDLRHKDAVELFRNAGYYVSLKIQRRLQPQNGPVGHGGDGESGGLPLAAILVPGLALAATAVWILLRYRQRM
ncbi:synaptojanin-2-binding protein isoform X2 [Hirundo rustica]|uniref:synaptojanin-2-binding protein isoform X2 n=1 Tax=Hirundo rustica TaxID=43150 RepID=UPI001A941C44|nr:synaptojanin-2-binding protein isoform X2 [Hirundo rustica]